MFLSILISSVYKIFGVQFAFFDNEIYPAIMGLCLVGWGSEFIIHETLNIFFIL